MTRRLDVIYYEWLISQIAVPSPNKTFLDLFELMHNTEFVWIVPNDDNRIQDGLDLRGEFMNETANVSQREIILFSQNMNKGATVLEVLIGLSKRVAFTAGGEAYDWAWKLIKNLRLNKLCDPFDDSKTVRTMKILEDLIWRTYERNGQGGFFPVKHSMDDQTKVEIWYQMNTYVNEMLVNER